MEVKKSYVINDRTSIVFPYYDEKGRLLSVVIENGKLFKVYLEPTQLMDHSLRCYGSSLRGAKDGSRMLLGNISMPPIVFGFRKKLYWLPTMSPSQKDCVWMAAGHVKDFKCIDNKLTSIVLSDDNEFILESSFSSFERKIYRTYELKQKVENRPDPGVIREKKATYLFRKKGRDRNYRKFDKE